MWAKKLSEAERSAYQDQQAEGLITLDEPRTKSAALEETRGVARKELTALKEGRGRMEDLERDAETLLEHYARMVLEALDNLTPEERHRVYKLLRLNAIMYRDGRAEITGAFTGLLDAMSSTSMKTGSTSSSTVALYAYTHVADEVGVATEILESTATPTSEGGYDLARFAAIRAWLERVRAQPDHTPITQA